MGPSEIAAVAASIKTAFDLAKGAKAAADALGDAEMKFKLAELTSALADAKIALAEAELAVGEKDREIERLKKSFQRMIDDTIEMKGYRFEKRKDGRPIGKPFCPRCLEVDGRLMRVEEASGERRRTVCPQCKASYHMLPEFYEPPAT